MKENKDCKIVQDLLPNYIEELTDPVTNEYIEKHIQTCSECREKLKNMNGEIKLERIDESREIDYLKKVRNRIVGLICGIVLILIVIASIISYIACNYYLKIDENGKKELVKNKEIETTNLSYMEIECQQKMDDQSLSINGYVTRKAMALINKDGIVLDIRESISNYTPEGLDKEYKKMIKEPTIYRDVNIVNEEIYFNRVYWKGKTKEELKALYLENYSNVIIKDW